MTLTKFSPFLLSEKRLNSLVEVTRDEPSIKELVHNYRRSLADVRELRTMLALELRHYNC
jgi:hypothetical protein